MNFKRLLPQPNKRWIIAIPYIWLLLLFLAPFFIVFKLSFSDIAIAIPPYTPIVEFVEDGYLQLTLNLNNYLLLFEDSLYIFAYSNSVRIALISTLLTLLIGFPLAYAMAKSSKRLGTILLLLIILPFWTSFLIRVYAWIGILKTEGLLNLFLLKLGIITQPLEIFGTDIAVFIGITYSYLPFMVLPLYATLEKIDPSLLEAAADLGCKPFKIFYSIVIPLAMPGILAGCFLVLIPAIGEFVIPDLLGGSNTVMIGNVLWSEFFGNRDWPLASAATVVLLLILVVPIVVLQNYRSKSQNE